MPTPSIDEIVDATRPSHTTCPPDDDRSNTWSISDPEDIRDNAGTATTTLDPEPAPQPSEMRRSASTTDETRINNEIPHIKKMELDEEGNSGESMSPASVNHSQLDSLRPILTNSYLSGSPSSYDLSNIRLTPSSPSSFMRAGSKFQGTQQSERQEYGVNVQIKHVDMRESFLCGYLRIQGLTEDHPTLTTYFEGEIIGSKYSFLTKHEDWGSTDKDDLQHWSKFKAFRPFQKQARKASFTIPDLAQRDNIFMRWKEQFLVPDHRVRTISGASFEGFYYICFNQIEGTVEGIYFHAKSEKMQRLELKHVPDRGTFNAMEFR